MNLAEDQAANRASDTEHDLRELERIWALPKGWRIITAVNNTAVGYFYIGAAFLFFLLAGILALLMRAQLAVPSNTLLSVDAYNQIFTMHGTVMMFLFAVPAVEAMGKLLLPQMLGARASPPRRERLPHRDGGDQGGVPVDFGSHLAASWPGLSRPSTSCYSI